MADKPSSSDENWSRVAHLYAKIANSSDPLTPNGMANSQLLSLLSSSPSLPPLSQASYIIDMGCGSGQLTSALLSSSSPIPTSAKIIAADVAATFVEMLKKQREEILAAAAASAASGGTDDGSDRAEKTKATGKKELWEKLEVKKWDARNLTEVQDGRVSHILATYAYFAMQDERQALAEALRVLAPGGVFVETSMGETDWGYLPQLLKNIKPEMEVPAPGKHWFSKSGTEEYLRGLNGFREVGAREFEISLPMGSAEEAVEFVWEVFPIMKGLTAGLSVEERNRAREGMVEWVRGKYPVEPFRMRGTGVMGWGVK